MQGPGRIELVLAVLAGAGCAVLSALVWRSVAAQQHVWPFPALYFSELIVLGSAEVAAFLVPLRNRGVIAWAAGGMLTAFSILGAWTVGLIFLPLALGFLATGVLADLQSGGRMGLHAGLALLAALAQAGFMLAMAIWF